MEEIITATEKAIEQHRQENVELYEHFGEKIVSAENSKEALDEILSSFVMEDFLSRLVEHQSERLTAYKNEQFTKTDFDGFANHPRDSDPNNRGD